ncbi:MAG: single-stranded DNA-binding protein [Bacteroidia bacterium]|nr:single-stranded DNA-binding protein [Bacteroidia bacterium]
MAKYGLNRVTLIGNLGQDPEMRVLEQGTAYCTLRLACTESYRDRNGNTVDRTEWINVTLWRSQAETAGKYLRKGATVYIEGRLRVNTWETAQGEKRSRLDVEGTRMIMLDGRPSQDGGFSAPVAPAGVNTLPHHETEPEVVPPDDDLPF